MTGPPVVSSTLWPHRLPLCLSPPLFLCLFTTIVQTPLQPHQGPQALLLPVPRPQWLIPLQLEHVNMCPGPHERGFLVATYRL